MRGRGPVQLEPIVLPPPPEQHAPAAPATPRHRGAPLQPLLQRPDATASASSPWWAPDDGDPDDPGDLSALLGDLEKRMPSATAMLRSDCLPMDHTLPHLLRQVAGTDDLESVQSIKLRVIGRETSLQRLCVYIPRLTELNLDGSSIGSLRELGCGLTGLRILRVTHCGLETLDGTFGLSALTELYAGYNRVEDIGYLACLPCIQLIDLRGNRVCDIRYAGFLTVCAFLRELVLADNPCAQQPHYRANIRELLPGLHMLDGVPLGSYQQDDEESDSTLSERTSESGQEADSAASAASTASAPGPDLPAPAPADATQIWADAERRAVSRLPAGSRPATASCATPRPRRPPLLSPRVSDSHSHWTGLAQRPASAIEMGTADAPSALTSGKAVCGNLTLALRKARTRREAWGQSEQQPDNNSTSTSSTYSSSSSLSDRVEYTPGSLDSSNVDMPSDSRLSSSYSDEDGILTASRRWRLAYQLYRDTNREKWEHELDS